MRVLIIGSTGQIGSALCLEAVTRKIEIVHAARNGQVDFFLDLAKPETLSEALKAKVDAVIIAAGYTAVDQAEDEPFIADTVNHLSPKRIAEAMTPEIPVIYYSTDYVFDGQDGPYSETALTNARSVYGLSKIAGEQAVLAASPNNLVLRTAVVYGPDPKQKNTVFQLLKAAREGRRLKVAIDQLCSPSFAPDVAAATFDLLMKRCTGIFHVVGSEIMSRAVFAQLACGVFGLDSTLVLECKTTQELGQKAHRPLLAGLSDDKLRDVLGHGLMGPRAGLLTMCAGTIAWRH